MSVDIPMPNREFYSVTNMYASVTPDTAVNLNTLGGLSKRVSPVAPSLDSNDLAVQDNGR